MSDNNSAVKHVELDGHKMRSEKSRIASFYGWPAPYVSYAKLARAGLFYRGGGDGVQCAFCGIVLSNWQVGDDPFSRHQSVNEKCPYVTEEDLGEMWCSSPSYSVMGGHPYFSDPLYTE